MSTQPTPQGSLQAPAQPSSVKEGYNTTDMLRALFEIKVPKGIPDNDPRISKMIIIESQSAKMRRDTGEFESRLTQTIDGIEASLNQLGKTKATLPLKQNYDQQVTPLKAETVERNNQRKQFTEAMITYVQEKDSKMAEVGKVMSSANPSDTQITAMLGDIVKKLRALLSQTEKLDSNEQSLQKKLDTLHHAAFLAIPPAERGNIAPPVALEEAEARRYGK